MKLPFSYLYNKMQQYFDCTESLDMDMDFSVSSPLFYLGNQNLETGSIYLAETGNLSAHIKLPLGSYIIYAGNLKFPAKRNMLKIKNPYSILQIYNIMYRIFYETDCLEQKLESMLYRKADFREILTCAGKFIDKPISLMNPQFYLEFYYQPEHFIETEGNDTPEQLNIPIVNALKSDDYYKAIELYEEAFTYSSKELQDVFYCINLLYKKQYIGRLIIRNDTADPCPWLLDFLNTIRHYVMPDYIRYLESRYPKEHYQEFLYAILTGQHYSVHTLHKFLEEMQWDISDYYLCCCVLPSKEDIDNNTIPYFVCEIEKNIPDTICVSFTEQIGLLIHLGNDVVWRKKYEETEQKLSILIRESNFRIGISRPFISFEKSCYGYQQAKVAMEYGEEIEPTFWKHTFDQMVLPYIYSRCLCELPKDFICHPAILQLMQIDKNGNSSYLETLRMYLECGQNIVQAAKRLYIHRGTMIYRMEKIREMTGLDLTSTKEQMYLLLSFHLFEDIK